MIIRFRDKKDKRRFLVGLIAATLLCVFAGYSIAMGIR